MKHKKTINLIKKCRRDSRTLSLQEIDDRVGVEEKRCSTFLRLSGLLAQGKQNNPKSESRNALITFRDPKTWDVQGEYYFFSGVFIAVCLVLVSIVIP